MEEQTSSTSKLVVTTRQNGNYYCTSMTEAQRLAEDYCAEHGFTNFGIIDHGPVAIFSIGYVDWNEQRNGEAWYIQEVVTVYQE